MLEQFLEHKEVEGRKITERHSEWTPSVGGRFASIREKVRLTLELITHALVAADYADVSVHFSITAAVDRTMIMTLSCRVGKRRLCQVVDTGATANVMPGKAYEALKQNSRGRTYVLRPSDTSLVSQGPV